MSITPYQQLFVTKVVTPSAAASLTNADMHWDSFP
jgi:hypothetical protein